MPLNKGFKNMFELLQSCDQPLSLVLREMGQVGRQAWHFHRLYVQTFNFLLVNRSECADVQADLGLPVAHVIWLQFLFGGAHNYIFMENYLGINVLIFRTLYTTFFCQIIVLYAFYFHKILGGMAKSVDPDQEQSDLGLHCLHMSFCQSHRLAPVSSDYNHFFLIILFNNPLK